MPTEVDKTIRTDKIYFSRNGKYINSWFGGNSEKLIWEIRLFGLTLSLWKKV